MTDLVELVIGWSKFPSRAIRITTQNWIVTHFCSRFSDVISRGETSGGVAKCRLFSQADMALHSPFCIFRDSCRIKVLRAKRYPYWLQTTPCYLWHQFKSTLYGRQLRNLLLEQHTTIKNPFSRALTFTYMNASSPQSDSLEQTTLEVDSPVSCSIPPILSDQGKCKISKYSQSPFNQFSFSIISFLAAQNWTELFNTRKDVDQKRILNPYFEQLWPKAAAPDNYLFIDIYDNNAQILKFTVRRPYKK